MVGDPSFLFSTLPIRLKDRTVTEGITLVLSPRSSKRYNYSRLLSTMVKGTP